MDQRLDSDKPAYIAAPRGTARHVPCQVVVRCVARNGHTHERSPIDNPIDNRDGGWAVHYHKRCTQRAKQYTTSRTLEVSTLHSSIPRHAHSCSPECMMQRITRAEPVMQPTQVYHTSCPTCMQPTTRTVARFTQAERRLARDFRLNRAALLRLL